MASCLEDGPYHSRPTCLVCLQVCCGQHAIVVRRVRIVNLLVENEPMGE